MASESEQAPGYPGAPSVLFAIFLIRPLYFRSGTLHFHGLRGVQAWRHENIAKYGEPQNPAKQPARLSPQKTTGGGAAELPAPFTRWPTARLLAHGAKSRYQINSPQFQGGPGTGSGPLNEIPRGRPRLAVRQTKFWGIPRISSAAQSGARNFVWRRSPVRNSERTRVNPVREAGRLNLKSRGFFAIPQNAL